MAFMRKRSTSEKTKELKKTIAPKNMVKRPLEYLVANFQGVGRREYQEDSFAFGNALTHEAITEKGLMAVVADGMGGLRHGKQASEMVTSSLLNAADSFDLDGDIIRQINDAVRAANDQVFEMLNGDGGSTVVVGLVYQEKLYYTSVGDSYVFLLHDHQLVRINRSQNVLYREYLDDILNGIMNPEVAKQNPEKDAITQFIGMPELEELDFFRQPLQLFPGDVLLLCSDGVGSVLEPRCLAECLRHGTPTDMCNAIEAEIQKASLRFQDNYTALIIQCRN